MKIYTLIYLSLYIHEKIGDRLLERNVEFKQIKTTIVDTHGLNLEKICF